MSEHLEDSWFGEHISPEAEHARYMVIASREPLVLLRALAVLQTEGERMIEIAVREAREAGKTWAQIGQALGVTRQAVQARWAEALAEGEEEDKNENAPRAGG